MDSEQRLPVRGVDGVPPEPKRRKVRKGTRSCWECKCEALVKDSRGDFNVEADE